VRAAVDDNLAGVVLDYADIDDALNGAWADFVGAAASRYGSQGDFWLVFAGANPGTDPRPPALAGLHWFGVVQYIGIGRTDDELFDGRGLVFSRWGDPF